MRCGCSDRSSKFTHALHFAAYGGFVQLVDLLLAHGADPSRKDDIGELPRVSRKQHVQIQERINQLLSVGCQAEGCLAEGCQAEGRGDARARQPPPRSRSPRAYELKPRQIGGTAIELTDTDDEDPTSLTVNMGAMIGPKPIPLVRTGSMRTVQDMEALLDEADHSISLAQDKTKVHDEHCSEIGRLDDEMIEKLNGEKERLESKLQGETASIEIYLDQYNQYMPEIQGTLDAIPAEVRDVICDTVGVDQTRILTPQGRRSTVSIPLTITAGGAKCLRITCSDH